MRERLYSKEYPEGKLFTDPEEYDKAVGEGVWFDADWKARGVIPPDLIGFVSESDMVPLKPKKTYIKEDIAKPVPNLKEEPNKEIKYCECGCGQVVAKRFAPGHFAIWKKKQKYPNVYGAINGNSKNDQPPD